MFYLTYTMMHGNTKVKKKKNTIFEDAIQRQVLTQLGIFYAAGRESAQLVHISTILPGTILYLQETYNLWHVILYFSLVDASQLLLYLCRFTERR